MDLDPDKVGNPPSRWNDLQTILNLLTGQYADVLDQDLEDNGNVRRLTWDVLELDKQYGNDNLQPDAEHVFIAILIEEGILSEIVTTNWDALIEKAHRLCRDGQQGLLDVVIQHNEIDGSRHGRRARLSKIHGCAFKAMENPAKYRPLMVATRTELQHWQTDESRRPMRELVSTILREKPALFVGLSGQDWDLQTAILNALGPVGQVPVDPPRVLFAEPSVTFPQQMLLRHFHGDEYRRKSIEVDKRVALGLYARQTHQIL